jgi:hypothetical protein
MALPLDPGRAFHLSPLVVADEFEMSGQQLAALMPWGVPGALGVAGRWKKSQDEGLLISFETPLEGFSTRAPISKEQEEQIQLERLRTDFLRRGEPLVGKISRGSEPPDFIVKTDEEEAGLDFTRFSLTKRMQAQALFRRLREALLEQPREEFAHLVGTTVYLWFDDKGFPSLPQREEDDLEALVSALKEHEVNPARIEDQLRHGLPKELDLQPGDSGRGAKFFALPMKGGSPSSFFYLSMGFEMGLAFQTDHEPASVWAEVQRLVSQHDQPSIDVLVISVGSPDRNGLIYPSEILLMDFALEHALPDLTIEHLKMINVHFWLDGRVIQLHPKVRGIQGPMYAGFFPSHFSTVQVLL